MKRECSRRDVLDVAPQKEKENHKFTFISEEINAWNTFWSIEKLIILCSETPFSKNSYYTETSEMICNAKWLVSKPSTFSVTGISKQILTHFQSMFHLSKPVSWLLLGKCLKKHLWKSDILVKMQVKMCLKILT